MNRMFLNAALFVFSTDLSLEFVGIWERENRI